jgi:hypothetical protein
VLIQQITLLLVGFVHLAFKLQQQLFVFLDLIFGLLL